MASQDTAHEQTYALALAPQTIAATTNGLDVDLQGHEAATFAVAVGTLTDGGYTPSLQHAHDDGSGSPDTYTAVPAADLRDSGFVEVTTANDVAVYECGYAGPRRWVRVIVTETSAGGTGGPVSAVAVLSQTRHLNRA